MKLLLDQNLSFKLALKLAPLFGEIVHVSDAGLSASSDQAVWDYAKAKGFTILSKDSDFLHRAMLYGSPPRVIWIQAGNASTEMIAKLLSISENEIHAFHAAEGESVLILPQNRLQ